MKQSGNQEGEKTMQQNNQIPMDANHERMINICGEMIECYTDSTDLEKFSAGYIALELENELIMQHLQPNGDYDGYIVICKNDIIKIAKGTRYIQKLELLKDIRKVVFEHISKSSENGFECLLNYALKNKRVISVQLLDSGASDIVGYVALIENGKCLVNSLDEYGEADGVCEFFIDDISFLSCDGDEERALDMLYTYQKGK